MFRNHPHRFFRFNRFFFSSSFHSSHRKKPHYPNPKHNPKPIPPPDPSHLQTSLSILPPRFTPQELSKTLTLEPHPLICLHLFNHASAQPRFQHDLSTFLITIKRLGIAQLFDEFDSVVSQAFSTPIPSSEPLFNTIIYYYTQDRKLTKAVNVFKHMKKSKDPASRPSIRTYNLLFTAMLSRGSNSYINHMYMETIRCLFRQMVEDGIEPDVFSLNSMIKGCIIHGLCAQGRSKNAKEFYGKMVEKGYVPSEKAYNSLVNCLAIAGEVDEAVRFLWEMSEKRKLADFITYRTVLDAIGREGKVEDAMGLLRELKEKDLVDGQSYRKLLYSLQDEFGDSDGKSASAES